MAKRTALYEKILEYSPQITEFGGWDMPLYFKGIIPEHLNVRAYSGIFDVSHMGKIVFEANPSVDSLFTIDPLKVPMNRAKYTMMLDEMGRIIDDMIVYRLSDKMFFLVPNAATVDLIYSRIIKYTTAINMTLDMAILSVQGPKSKEIMETLFGEIKMPFYGFKFFSSILTNPSPLPITGKKEVLLSRTGYTGELGYELYVPNKDAISYWNKIFETEDKSKIMPIGLGARDTLRLEKGYLLSGSDFHNDKTPVEANLMKFIDLEHNFIGKEAVIDHLNNQKEFLCGIVMDKTGAIPRHSSEIYGANGEQIGHVTSGTISPSLKKGIALGYISKGKKGDKIKVKIRNNLEEGTVVDLPFL
jgi:aminomethyltransferase